MLSYSNEHTEKNDKKKITNLTKTRLTPKRKKKKDIKNRKWQKLTPWKLQDRKARLMWKPLQKDKQSTHETKLKKQATK